MPFNSILLGLDGSAQSRYAAELAWAMAKSSNAKVDALHVIDSLAAWDFLGFDIAGFIGSGPYFAAHETMRNSLQTIGQNLIDVYKTMAESQKIEGETFLDEGTTIREICWRANDHDMVILGHRSTGMGSPEEDKRKIPRRSVAESLTHYINKPLLVVQDRVKYWSHMRILLSSTSIPSDLIRDCVEFAKVNNIKTSVRYLFPVEHMAQTEAEQTFPDGLRVVTDLTKLVPDLADAVIDVRTAADFNAYLMKDAEADPDTLLVVPVTEVAGLRRTSLGMAPELLVRYMNHPAILFWVDEQPVHKELQPKGKGVSTKAP